VVSGIALNTNSPALLGHAENEGPSLLRVEVGIRQHQEALILAKLYILLEVFENLASVELFHFSVTADSGVHDTLLLKLV
jgi:hypothetical protein